MRAWIFMVGAALFSFVLAACSGGLQRGMLDGACVSTSRPALSMKARHLPLLTAGEANLFLPLTSSGASVPVQVWLAAYGDGRRGAPLAVAALAELRQPWYWDGDGRKPFSVDNAVETLGGMAFQAGTYLADSRRDPFAPLAGSGGEPVRWVVRGFAARCNFDQGRVVLEYREPAPAELADQPHLLIGGTDWLRAFEERARTAFALTHAPADRKALARGTTDKVAWRYMDERFLGTMSQHESLPMP